MAESYLLVSASDTRLLFAASDVIATIEQAPDEASDLSARLGGGPAAAWVAGADGRNFGVSRLIGLFDLEPADFAALPRVVAAQSGVVDAVTRNPIRGAYAFRFAPHVASCRMSCSPSTQPSTR